MRAMVLKLPHSELVNTELPQPKAGPGELLIKVAACGVCRTDLHIIEGDLPSPDLPLILGHEIVGRVEEVGKGVTGFNKGDRIGIPWMGKTCGTCEFCKSGKENLCDRPTYTGYTTMGGFAEYTRCDAAFAIPLNSDLSDAHLAPLLCAGLIGYRAYQKAAPDQTLGLYGFGAAAHILTQLAVKDGKKVYAFTRPGDTAAQEFARELGATWAGDSTTTSPILLDAAIIFAPEGSLVPRALNSLKKGGKCILGGIHMSDIPSFSYQSLWNEKRIESVANLTRADAHDFFKAISNISIQTQVTLYPLESANQALSDLKIGKFQGAAVLIPK